MMSRLIWPLTATSILALTACGDKKSEVESLEPLTSVTETEAAPVAIPEAPKNPLVAINADKAAAFFEENGTKEGVRTLEDGLQILTTEEGTGETPGQDDIIRFHYVGRFIDGQEFDKSTILGEPLVIPNYRSVPIPGVPAALALMKEGEKATIFVPPALAFGEEGLPGMFEPNTPLIFDLEVFEIVTADEPERRAEIEAEQMRLQEEARAEAEAKRAAANEARAAVAAENLAASQAFLSETAKREGVTTTESGLQYEVLSDGGAGATPSPTDTVRVHYRGTLRDGTPFDSSYDGGEPIEFQLDRVIPGWTEGVGLMNAGDKYRFFIPPELGYREMGTPGGPIGPNEALVFEVELLNITPSAE